MDLRAIARALGGEVRGGQVLCPGPGHSTTDRSLSVRLDPSAPGGILVHSFSGDDPITCKDYVRQKCALPAFGNGNGRPRRTEAEIERAVLGAIKGQQGPSHVVCRYSYTDADGTLLYEIERLEPKSFRARRPDGSYSLKGFDRRVLYRLPELLKYPDATVFLCEGERDADNVAKLGHCATTVAFGQWSQESVDVLANRDVIILEDADAAGRKKATVAAKALYGTAKTIRIVRLPGLTGEKDSKDVSDWLDADPHRARTLVDVCFDAPLWEPPAVEEKEEPPAEEEKETPPPPAETPPLFCDITAWCTREAPERKWAVHERFPLRNVALITGEGAVGKSILLMQLTAAHVLSRDWLGTLPEPGPVIYLNAEDEEDELERRFAAITAACGASLNDLKSDLHLLPLAGKDAVLGHPDRNGLIKPTPLFTRLKEAARDIRPKLIGLDTSADIYAGSENDRSQVRQFIGLMRGMAIDANAGVIICAHPSLTGISTGTGLSGSTAWHNSVRARAYLHAVTTDDGTEVDQTLRQLDFAKNNYGPIAEKVLMRWKAGVFVLEPKAGSLEKLAADQKTEQVFLELLERFNGQCRYVNDKGGRAYAPALFAKEPQAAGISNEMLAAAMRRLFTANKIHLEAFGYKSRGAFRLVQGPKP
jgi:RecA-family ATPase/5S rRNA maturation endonuclease (ribonuclease M5)